MTAFIHHYQAIFARNPFGYLLTKNLRVSSHKTRPAPNPNATISIVWESLLRMNQYSTCGALVSKILWKNGVRRNNNIIESVIDIAPKIYKFLVFLEPIG